MCSVVESAILFVMDEPGMITDSDGTLYSSLLMYSQFVAVQRQNACRAVELAYESREICKCILSQY